MLFRFTLSNTIEGSHVITDPDGWKDIKLKLERDKEYHSLVEIVELPLIFYRTSDLVDGGYNYITNIETTQGIDAQIGILIEVSDDEVTYETFFEGLLLLETIKDISDSEFYKLECNVARTSLWSKFFSRKSQDVNLNATVDLDGNARTPVLDVNLSLPPQALDLYFLGYVSIEASTLYLALSSEDYGVIEFADVELAEVKQKLNYPQSTATNVSATRPFELFAVEYAGSYLFDIKIVTSRNVSIPPYFDSTSANLHVKLQINEDTAITLTKTNVGSDGVDGRTEHTYNGSISLEKGDFIRLYFNETPALEVFVIAGVYRESYISIVASTIYPSTETDAFLLRDAFESNLSKIIGRENVLYSDYLGDTGSGCASNYAILKGLHARGYRMADKPMTASFDDLWNGSDPIFNLSLSYETIASVEYIRIEDKGYVYNPTPSLTLDYVGGITRTYDKDKIFKSVEIGYQKWSAESASGVDDPQTKHTYNTRFKIVGKDEKVLSSFFAGSLGIEQTRRNRVEQGKDWRLDEDILIIALANDTSPLVPETNQEFTDITNLKNSDTRYNIRITPARNFDRWKAFFNGCLQSYLGEFFKFGSGEGNVQTQTTGISVCDSGTIAENQDILVTGDNYHSPIQYDFEDDLTWDDYKIIRNARTQAILVSNTNADHKTFFIDELEYDRYNAKAKFKGWIKEEGLPVHPYYLAILLQAANQGDTAPDFNQKVKQNRLVTDLVDAGIWDDLDFLYVFAHNGGESFGYINWISPTTHRITKSGTVTFTPSDGSKGNGTTGAYDTNWNPSTYGVNWTQNEAGFFIQVKETTGATEFVCGGADSGGTTPRNCSFRPRSIVDTGADALNNAGSQNPAGRTDASGLWHVQRTGVNTFGVYRNGVSTASYGSTASDGLTSSNLTVFARQVTSTKSGFSSKTIRVYGGGASLIGKESLLNSIWDAYFNSL